MLVRSAAGWPITRGVWDAGSCLQRAEQGCACPAPRRWLPAWSVGQGHFPDSWDSPWTGCPSSQSAAGACPKVTIWVSSSSLQPGTTTPTPQGSPQGAQHPAGSGGAERSGQHWLQLRRGAAAAAPRGRGSRGGWTEGTQPGLRVLLLPRGPRWNRACCIPPGPAPRVPPWSQCPEWESPSSPRSAASPASAVGIGDAAEQKVPFNSPRLTANRKARNWQRVKGCYLNL